MTTSATHVYWHATDAIEYTIRHTEHGSPVLRSRRFNPRPDCVKLLRFYIADGQSCTIPCHTGEDEEDYYQFYEEEFTDELYSQYPDISAQCAAKVTDTFIEILQNANATHTCSHLTPYGEYNIVHTLEFQIQPLRGHHHVPPTEFIISEEEAAAYRPRQRPASAASIRQLLLTASDRIHKDGEEHMCAICMEDMEDAPGNTLTMPCSHSFHHPCLLRWLNNSHSCPLCRYQMPAAQY